MPCYCSQTTVTTYCFLDYLNFYCLFPVGLKFKIVFKSHIFNRLDSVFSGRVLVLTDPVISSDYMINLN